MNRGINVFILSYIIMTVFASATLAHKVNIFAYIQGDSIHSTSYFSDGKKCRNSRIEVFNISGEKFLEGKTNQEGEFSFKRPNKTGLKLVLNAGLGHGAECLIEWEDEVPKETVAKAEKPGGRISATEVIGGIGYIFGIMGLIMYFKARRISRKR